MKEWLLERWTVKDALLESFRKEGHFPGQVGLAACLHTGVLAAAVVLLFVNDNGDCVQARPLPGSLVRSVWTLSYCTALVVLVAAGWWRLLRRLLLLSRGRLLSR